LFLVDCHRMRRGRCVRPLMLAVSGAVEAGGA
jgi:hypothetical protein